ncbi:DMT family transporter [Pseudoalteromonas sp. SG43-3]|uniref:DMT family transporter n=1 Tax=Pseudoalteromonas sp. SG43-3 TaxID=2760970 RepID=UPI0015FF926D|nr:DMT family transporter [Pseudoalteromonas sp. SG43-3]MBB1442375.1 DMT family transporter [Pseudoalteromonas sp. SG43-3]|tara:strand:- start:3211 stop:3678 length:468 start_codon:yes stop_codon:yes gene_type:complete
MMGLMLLAIISGMALSSQAAINGQLGAKVGVIHSSLLTFAVGTVITMLLIFFFEPSYEASLLTVPKWQLTGALFGIAYMVMMVSAVPKVGVATATVATIFGQMVMSLVIDTRGWLGNTPIELNYWRLAAMLCIACSLICIYLSNKQQENHSESKS